MASRWLSWLNISLAGLGVFLLLCALILHLIRPSEIIVPDTSHVKNSLPINAFAHSKDLRKAIGNSLLSLKFSPLTMQLPDLKRHLIFYGRNGRPDAQLDQPLLYFSFNGNKTPTSIKPSEKFYIFYDRRQPNPQYTFSPNNMETPLWIEAIPKDQEVEIRVGMKNEKGDIVQEPAGNARFNLQQKEYVRTGGTTWELGKWRVDGSLLARQKARWYGADRFLEQHGGDEYKDLQGKHRIDFGEGENLYSVFVGLKETLVWKEDKWNVLKPGPDTIGHPILVVNKMDERLMGLELWDAEGKGKINLNLLKSNENWVPQNLQQNFKFVGARTRSQFVFEVDKERMLLSPQDWLVLTEEGWIKLETPEDIDNYVNRKLTGPMFVFDGISRKEDRQVFIGKMYNTSRTDMQAIEMPVLNSENSKDENIKPATGQPNSSVAKSRFDKAKAGDFSRPES